MISALVGGLLWLILFGLPQGLMNFEPDECQARRWMGIESMEDI